MEVRVSTILGNGNGTRITDGKCLMKDIKSIHKFRFYSMMFLCNIAGPFRTVLLK